MKAKRPYNHSAAFYAKQAAKKAGTETTKVTEALPVTTHLTDSEIEKILQDRFDVIEALTEGSTTGNVRAWICAGPPGLGKTFTIERILAAWDPSGFNYTHIKGYVKATGLYKLLHQFKEKGQVLVLDDADSVFFEDTALALLKAVCDTTEKRTVHYLAEGGLVDDETGAKLPRSFDFEGTVIFVTNLDFDKMIAKGHKLSPHLAALQSRAHYIDLAMTSRRHYLVRIRQVIKQGLLKNQDLTIAEQKDVVDFIENNVNALRELSLRMAIKLGNIRKMGPRWQQFAHVTCCKAA